MDGDKVVGNNRIISHPLGLPSNVDLTASSPADTVAGWVEKNIVFLSTSGSLAGAPMSFHVARIFVFTRPLSRGSAKNERFEGDSLLLNPTASSGIAPTHLAISRPRLGNLWGQREDKS